MPVRLPGPRNAGRVGDRQAEVDQLDPVLAIEQVVARVDVVVDETGRVHGGQPLGGLGQPLDLLGGPAELASLGRLEALAVDKLHEQIVLAAVVSPYSSVFTTWGWLTAMAIAPSGGPRLLARGPGGRRVVLLAVLHLQADRAARLVIDGPVNSRHAPLARGIGHNGEPSLQVHA